jgi:cobalamin biosynthesis protein CobD/CbiB
VRATLSELIFGVALDLAIGEPRRLAHPVWFALHQRGFEEMYL